MKPEVLSEDALSIFLLLGLGVIAVAVAILHSPSTVAQVLF